jgi:predicted RNA methylase
MPGLQEGRAVIPDEALDSAQLVRAEPDSVRHGDGVEPELGRAVVPVDVYVGWLVGLLAVCHR